MTDDLIIAREAQLVFANSPGWTPVGNSLKKWEGSIRTSTGKFKFNIFLPEYFPNVPPVVQCNTPASHPNIDSDGFVKMRILENWRGEFHSYQVINALKGLMSRVPPRFEASKQTNQEVVASIPISPKEDQAKQAFRASTSDTRPPQPQVNPAEIGSLRDELRRLKHDMTERDEELARYRARRAFGIEASEETKPIRPESASQPQPKDEGHDAIVELESEYVALSELLAALHEKYSSGEASFYDFARLYKKYTRNLHVAKKKLDYLKNRAQ